MIDSRKELGVSEPPILNAVIDEMRSGPTIPLTLEEHRDLGAEVRNARLRMRQLCDLVVGVYGPNNQAAFTFLKAVEDLDRLNQDMRAQAAQDLPGYPVEQLYP
jgi:hypothetical protein